MAHLVQEYYVIVNHASLPMSDSSFTRLLISCNPSYLIGAIQDAQIHQAQTLPGEMSKPVQEMMVEMCLP